MIDNENIYSETTGSITIKVSPIYLEEQSEPDEAHYVWAYHVRIENNGAEPVQLLTRYWCITDGVGHIHEVRGDGVIGEQPVLSPGGSFEYTSGTPLGTPTGMMGGTYGMRDEAGSQFDATIPTFSLDSPHFVAAVH
jgi:ApaG protein